MAAEPGSRGRIIVFGILFWYPLAGVTYQFLHYLLALRRLGYDPYYIEDSGRWVYDPALNDLSPDAAPQHRGGGAGARGARLRRPLGVPRPLPGRPLLRHDRRRRSSTLYREADAFLNVTGAQEIREEHMQCPRRIYVESDPFASQVKVANGEPATIAALDAHDTHFTFGENIGQPDCGIPVDALPAGCRRASRWSWICGATRTRPADAPYTTITTWHNTGKDVVYNGERYYWTKDREFEHFLDLPRRRAGPFELAVGVDDATRQRLERPRLAAAPLDRPVGERHRLPRLHPALARRVHRGARPVRAAAHRLVQRSHRLLPGRRPAGDHRGHRLRQVHPDRPRPVRVHARWTTCWRPSTPSKATTTGTAARPARSPRTYFGAERVVGSLMARAGL